MADYDEIKARLLLLRNASRVADAIRGTAKDMDRLVKRIPDGDKDPHLEGQLRGLMETIVKEDPDDWDLDENL